jgi:hypothetical protein
VRAAFSYQLNKQIQKDMQMEKVDQLYFMNANYLFWLKADC